MNREFLKASLLVKNLAVESFFL